MVVLLVALGGALPTRALQEAEKGAGARRADEGVPLDKLPLPANGMVVVTPDLKKALDALGAGSVVLSAERYRELMQRLAAAGQDKAGDILFSALRIDGEVKTVGGRETAELVFELEFRTDTPNALVPIPFKGVRFSEATLNGAAPVWGPDPEKLGVLVKEPQACKMRLSATVAVTRVGSERRLTVERVPAAAVTALDLKVPGAVAQAAVLGSGPVPVTRAASGMARLQSAALGILTGGLDLTWQLGEAAPGAGREAIEGDIRVSLDESGAQVEARLRPTPFAPLRLPWKLRLPDGVTGLKAELLRVETAGSEPLVVTRGNEGVYTVASAYPTAAMEFNQLMLRWRQPLGAADLKTKVVLGTCEVVEPAGRSQSGTMSVTMPEPATVMLRPVNVAAADRDPWTGPGEPDRRVTRYRYAQQPAGLEVIALPAVLVRAAVEFKLTHLLTVRDGLWLLTTDVEVTRTARAQLTALEFSWPAEWAASRKVLFSPVVRDFEQDTKGQKLRVALDGKQAGVFTLRLESTAVGNPAQVSLNLPYVTGAQGVQNDRPIPVEVIPQLEKLKLEPRTWELKVDPTMTGLREDGEGAQYQVIAHPAVLNVAREPRRPRYRSRAELYVGKELLQTRQTFELRWNGPAPRRLNVLVPAGSNGVQFFRHVPEVGHDLALTASVPGGVGEAGGWETRVVDVPSGVEQGLQLVCQLNAPAESPATAPLVRFADGQASPEGPVEVRVVHDVLTGVKVPELPGWRPVSERAGELELRGDSLNQLLALELTAKSPGAGIVLGRVRECRVTVEQDVSRLLAQYEWTFEEVRTTELALLIPTGDVTAVAWTLDGQPVEARRAEQEGGTVFTVKIPPRRLWLPVQLKATLQYPPPSTPYAFAVPAAQWVSGSVAEGPRLWQVAVDPTAWLLDTNLRADESFHVGSTWLPLRGEPAGRLGAALTFHDAGRDDGLRVWTAPRSAVVLVFSVVALGCLRGAAARRGWLRRGVVVAPIVIVVLHLLTPTVAAALLWGVLPGVAVALLLLGVEQVLRRRTRRPAVFQTGGGPGATPAPGLPSPGSVVAAEAPTLVPVTRSQVP